MTEKTRRVVLALPYTDRSGVSHKQGATVTLPDLEARDLLRGGLARSAPEPATTAAAQAATTAGTTGAQDTSADTAATTAGTTGAQDTSADTAATRKGK